MALRCEAGYVFCRHVAERQCIICERFFCANHGNLEAGYCRHCRRIYNQRVVAEMVATAEAARQTAAAARNASGLCGWEGCAAPPLVLCQHDGLLYCTRHTNHYRYSYHYRTRRGIETRRAEVTLCDACKAALPDYKRERTYSDEG